VCVRINVIVVGQNFSGVELTYHARSILLSYFFSTIVKYASEQNEV